MRISKIPYLLVYSIPFFQVGVINSAGVADICIAFIVFLSFIFFTFRKGYTDRSVSLLLSFLIVVLVVSLFNDLYSYRAFINGFVRILCLSLCYYYLPYWFTRKSNLEGFIRQMSIVLCIISLLVLIEFVFLQLNLSIDMSLIKAQSHMEGVNEGRVKIIFSEPAVVAIIVAIFLTSILFYYKDSIKIPRLVHASVLLSFLSLFLTSSLTGILFLFLFLYYFYLRKAKAKLLFLIILIIFLCVAIVLGSSFVMDAYADRIGKVFLLEDSSTNRRLIGSWYYVFSAIQDNEFMGIGLNQTVAFSEKTTLVHDFFNPINPSVNNTFAAILLELGYLGLISYIIFTLSVFKKNYFFLLVFILLCMAGTVYYFSITWFFFYMARIFNMDKINNTGL